MDEAHGLTDDAIDEVTRRLERAYAQAEREMREKAEAFMKDFSSENAEWMAKVQSGEKTSDEYDAWLRDRALDRNFVNKMAETLARDATDTDRLARDMVNDEIPKVYAENANYAAYGIETSIGYDTHSFDLYDVDTVRRLIREQPNLVPMADINGKKDYRWNRQKFSSAITQSVLQGESIPATAKRLRKVLGMDKRAAISAARTAMTGAENAGRMDSYKRAEGLGIQLEKQWMATLDERTRLTHRELDGQHVPIDEPFEVDGEEIQYPADPKARGDLVWNCRCTTVAWTPEMEAEDANVKRFSRLPENLSYEDWKAGKNEAGEEEPKAKTFAELLDECTTSAEVGKVMDSQGWWNAAGDVSELTDVDVVAAKKLAETYKMIFDTFPMLQGKFMAPDTDERRPTAYASCSYDTGQVHLNTHVRFSFANWDALQRTYGRDVDHNFHPDGTTGVAVVVHELGHAIDGWMRRFTYSKEFVSEVGYTKFDENLRKVWGNPWARKNGAYSFANALRANTVKAATGKRFTNATVQREVSTYATKNAAEFFAEAFAEYICSEKPRRVAAAFGEELKRLLGERERIEQSYRSKHK